MRGGRSFSKKKERTGCKKSKETIESSAGKQEIDVKFVNTRYRSET